MHIGLIGCGRWGAHILRDLIELEAGVSVVARSDASIQRALDGGARKVVDSIVGLQGVDGLVVATPTISHYEVLKEVIALYPKTPIFCEKCLTADGTQAEEICKLAGERLFVMDKWRYHPGVIQLATLARSGEMGRIQGIKTTRIGLGSPHIDVDPIWILMPHDLSIVLEICAHLPEPRAAAAEMIGQKVWGMTAQLGHSPWAACHVSACSDLTQRSVVVYFEKGVASLSDAYADSVKLLFTAEHWNITPRIEHRSIGSNMPLKSELAAFLSFIRGEAEAPKSSAFEAAAMVKTIERLRTLAGVA